MPRERASMQAGANRGIALIALLAAIWSGGCGVSGVGSGDEGIVPTPSELAIADLRVGSVTDTSAVIRWSTSRPAVGVLRYGLSSDLAVSVGQTSDLALEHDVLIRSLAPHTTYHYRVQALTGQGDTTSQRGTPFATAPPMALNDSTPPAVQEIQIVAVTSSSARIEWQTDDLCRCRVLFGPTRGYGSAAEEYPDDAQKYTRGHALTLTDLNENTVYHFVIQATNYASLTGESDDETFRTEQAPTVAFCCGDTLIAQTGGTFEVPICLSQVQDLAGVALTVTYDPSVLEAVEGSSGVRIESFWQDHNGHLFMPAVIDRQHGRLLIEATWSILYDGDAPTGTDADGEGALCTLLFRYRTASPPAATPVGFLLTDQNGDSQPDTRLLDCYRLPMRFAAHGAVIVPAAR